MVRTSYLGALASAVLLIGSLIPIAPNAQDRGAPEFSFDKQAFEESVNAILQTQGIRAYFRTYDCLESDEPSDRQYKCRYNFSRFKYTVSYNGPNGKATIIVARRLYGSRFYLDQASMLGLTALIASIEGTTNDQELLDITDRLVSAGRSLSGTTKVDTKRATYTMMLDRDGYAFVAQPSMP